MRDNNKRLDRVYDQQKSQYNEQMEKDLAEKRQGCHRIFKTSNYEAQKNFNPQKAEGTCQWALQSPEYVRWDKSNCNDLLWVSADPGCGKSVLARSIIDGYMENYSPSSGVTICYFFFKENNEQDRLATALCSVLHQIFSQRPQLLKYAIGPWERNGNSICQDANALWNIFLEAASADHREDSSYIGEDVDLRDLSVPSKTICIFDALDECREHDQNSLIGRLKSFYHKQNTTENTCLKFLVTSRPYMHIENHFRTITESFPHLRLKGEEENDQLHEEINKVVKAQVKDLAKTARLSSDAQQKIEQHLLQLQHRTYLWLQLAMDDIRSTFQNSFRPARELIKMIPPSVDKAYEKILRRVPANKINEVRRAFQILLGARRPLTIIEMAMAFGISTRPESRTAAEAGIDPVIFERLLRSVCGLFVYFNDSKVYFIHLTARDYLCQEKAMIPSLSTFFCSFTDAEDQMAQICLRYLLIEDFDIHQFSPTAFSYGHKEPGTCLRVKWILDQNEDPDYIYSSAFLRYSAVHWASHVRNMSAIAQREASDLLDQIYHTTQTERFWLWFPLYGLHTLLMPMEVPRLDLLAALADRNKRLQFSPLANGMPRLDALQLAALTGHLKILHRLLLESGTALKVAESTCFHPLELAAGSGRSDSVSLILKNGGDVNAHRGSALKAACISNQTDIVAMLLRHGAHVNQQDQSGTTALYIAFSCSFYDIVHILLNHGADPNLTGGDHAPLLHQACRQEKCKDMLMLLQSGADVNIRDKHGNDALHDTCRIISLNRNLIYREFRTLGPERLHAGHRELPMIELIGPEANSLVRGERIISTLLKYGSDVNNTQSSFGYSVLQEALLADDDKLMEMLLKYGADVHARMNGEPMLHHATVLHLSKIVHILLSHGADVNASNESGVRALHLACGKQFNDLVQTLLEHGADVNAQGPKGKNALGTACSLENKEMVQILLEYGVDVNAQDETGVTALHIACANRNKDLIEKLLKHGADPDTNMQSMNGRSVLEIACLAGDEGSVQTLLEHGANVNAQGANAKTTLDTACALGNESIVQILLNYGADVHAQDGHGANPLHSACVKGNMEIVQKLLKYGADADKIILGGRSVLDIACVVGNEKIVQILLEHGADVGRKGMRYSSALEDAESAGHERIVQMLLEHGGVREYPEFRRRVFFLVSFMFCLLSFLIKKIWQK